MAAAAVSVEALYEEIAALKHQLSAATESLNAAESQLAACKAEFEAYKADAQAILAEAAQKVIVSDKPVLEVNGELYTFKMGKFSLGGKNLTAAEIIANAGAFEAEIQQLIHKYKILKPFKPKEA